MRYNQGRFKPKNPSKYKGDIHNIIYRSHLELKMLLYLDSHPDIIEYSSEEIIIPYKSPVDGKIHRYFPDMYIKKRNKDGSIDCALVEIKPYSQTIEPKHPVLAESKRDNRKAQLRYIKEVHTYAINTAKWQYAQEYCQRKNWQFIIITEKDLNVVYKK